MTGDILHLYKGTVRGTSSAPRSFLRRKVKNKFTVHAPSTSTSAHLQTEDEGPTDARAGVCSPGAGTAGRLAADGRHEADQTNMQGEPVVCLPLVVVVLVDVFPRCACPPAHHLLSNDHIIRPHVALLSSPVNSCLCLRVILPLS